MGNRPDPSYIANLRRLEAADPFCRIDNNRKTLNGVDRGTAGPTGTNGDAGAHQLFWSPTDSTAWCPSRTDQAYQSNGFLADRDMTLILRKNSSFAKMVLDGKGKLAVSIREWQGNSDNHWTTTGDFNAEHALGHGYLAINTLGKLPNATTASVMKEIGQHINKLFPGGVGGDDKNIRYGIIFDLQGWNHVQVVYVCDYFAVFQTTKHILQGVAIHGVVEDSAGEFWMFQEGWGEPVDPALMGLGWATRRLIDVDFNYFMARRMWKQFAEASKEFLQQHPPGAQ